MGGCVMLTSSPFLSLQVVRLPCSALRVLRCIMLSPTTQWSFTGTLNIRFLPHLLLLRLLSEHPVKSLQQRPVVAHDTAVRRPAPGGVILPYITLQGYPAPWPPTTMASLS